MAECDALSFEFESANPTLPPIKSLWKSAEKWVSIIYSLHLSSVLAAYAYELRASSFSIDHVLATSPSFTRCV